MFYSTSVFVLDLDSEESEYDAYVFYQLLEEQTSPHHTLVEDIKITADLAKVRQVRYFLSRKPCFPLLPYIPVSIT